MEIKFFSRLKKSLINFMKVKTTKNIDQADFDTFCKNLSPEQQKLSSRFFDLAIGRVLKRAYHGLDVGGKENMKKVFLSDNDKDKEIFIKKYIPSFKKMFKEESDKIREEIKEEIKKQNQGK